MERYRLILRHEYVDNNIIDDIEEPIECTININDLDDSISFSKYLLYDMCESILRYIDLEKEDKLNDSDN